MGIEEKGIKLSGKKVARPIYEILFHEWDNMLCSNINIIKNLSSSQFFQNKSLVKFQAIQFHAEAISIHELLQRNLCVPSRYNLLIQINKLAKLAAKYQVG